MSHALGVDVSKATLEACAVQGEPSRTFANSEVGIAKLLKWANSYQPSRVVFEASGGYERRLLEAVMAGGGQACLVNAQQVRHFAKALGKRAKTDPVDAAVLQRFGDTMAPRTYVPPSPEQARLLTLVKRRVQLVAMRTQELNRAHQADKAMAVSHRRVCKALNAEIKRLEKQIIEHLQRAPALQATVKLLATTPGIATITAANLCSTVPELGHRSRGAISALTGVAPVANDSGTHHGQRHIAGGRALPRIALYQATLTALRCNPRIKALYARLKAKGKPSKVAMTACMRVLLCSLNAMVRDNKPWSNEGATA